MTELVLTPTDPRDAPVLTLKQQIAAYAKESTASESSERTVVAIVTEFIRSTKLAPELDGEPTFTIRSQDKRGPYHVQHWASEAEAAGCSHAKVEDGFLRAAHMIAWQMANPTRVKNPD